MAAQASAALGWSPPGGSHVSVQDLAGASLEAWTLTVRVLAGGPEGRTDVVSEGLPADGPPACSSPQAARARSMASPGAAKRSVRYRMRDSTQGVFARFHGAVMIYGEDVPAVEA